MATQKKGAVQLHERKHVPTERRTIAITGGSGFIGQHLLSELDQRNIAATVLTRKPNEDGYLTKSLSSPVYFDLTKTEEDTYDQIGSPNLLFHLAWNHLDDFNSNAHLDSEWEKHYNFLLQMVKSGLKTLVVSGTCLEYGLSNNELEEQTPSSPVTSYGRAKLKLCDALIELQKDHPFNLVWGRIFYIYGDGQSRKGIFNQLKDAITNQDRTFKMSPGDQLRDFIPAEKAVELLVTLGLNSVNAGIVNISSGNPISVTDFIQAQLKKMAATIILEKGYYDYPSYEPMAFWGSTKKLDGLLLANKNKGQP